MKKYIKIDGYTFQVLKPDSVKARELKSLYNNASGDLGTVYSRPNPTKRSIYNKGEKGAEKNNGWNVKATTGHSTYFSLAFKINYNNITYLAYISPCYHYLISLTDTAERNPETLTVEEVKERYNKLNPSIKKALQSCPTLTSLEQVESVLHSAEVFSIMADLLQERK